MRIYVATKWSDREHAHEVMNWLEGLGHTIVLDWTQHEGSGLSKAAVNDAVAVCAADVLVFLADHGEHFKGAYVEMGMAMGAGKTVIVVGHKADGCVFTHHPTVYKVDTIDELQCLSYVCSVDEEKGDTASIWEHGIRKARGGQIIPFAWG